MFFDLSFSIFGKLLLAVVLGGVVGLERQIRRKPAGLRTSILICLGAAFFTIISAAAATHPEDDHTRIAAQIVAGIGFIGAGAILRERGGIVGLTTAATIWAIASVGMGVGAGLYWSSVFATLLILVVLTMLGWAEGRFALKTRVVAFRLTTTAGEPVMKRAREILEELGIPVQHFQVRRAGNELAMEFDADVSFVQEHEVSKRMSELDARCEVAPLEFQRE